ncbi:MAG: imidazolonepropionase [Desulfobacteraceae bacterium]|nr:MAG: imidazolonepropionase [Desulfobacteraceae bacterium]
MNCRMAAMTGNGYGLIDHAALAVSNGRIQWLGPMDQLADNDQSRAEQVTDCNGLWMLPGFVDCHTHLVWGGSRSDEFEMRLNGVSYEQIAKQGGGIASTVKATRGASEDELYNEALKRVNWLMAQGITTLEIKSGYGLDTATELKMLRVIDRLDKNTPVSIHATFLGAHALPPEFKGNSGGYIDQVCQEMLPAVRDQGIATAVDGFCETIGFTHDQTRQVFEAASDLGFDVKLHAEQLSDSNGASLAASFNALSCDHLEYLSRSGAEAMAEHDVTAVLLPGAFYCLKETQKPPVSLFREFKIPMALSTDLNPGSSPIHSLSLILNMGCTLFDMTPLEAIAGTTLNGARALGLAKTKGTLDVGKDADFALWDIQSPADLCYLAGYAPLKLLCIGGKAHVNRL